MVIGVFTITLVRKDVGVALLMDQPVNAYPGYGYAFKSSLLLAGTNNVTEDQ
jgi:hypothetical protein